MNTVPVYRINYSDSSILYEFPAGKPDRSQEFKTGLESRNRVYLPKQKDGFTCIKYALDRMRIRIGKVYDKNDKDMCQAHHVEQTISEYYKDDRKIIEKTTCSLPIPDIILQNLSTSFSSCKSQSDKYDVIERCSNLLKSSSDKQNFINSFKRITNSFEKQNDYKDFYTYYASLELQAKQEQLERLIQVFKDLHAFKQIEPVITSPDITTQQKHKGFLILIPELFLDKFGLKSTSWTPNSSINTLYTELRLRKVLYISGFFGKPYYKDDPKLMNNKMGDREIYYWPKGSTKVLNGQAHAVLVVGVDTINNLVLYIDPKDPSDPKSKSTQRIYATSYSSVQENSVSVDGYLSNRLSKSQKEEKKWHYYSPFMEIVEPKVVSLESKTHAQNGHQ